MGGVEGNSGSGVGVSGPCGAGCPHCGTRPKARMQSRMISVDDVPTVSVGLLGGPVPKFAHFPLLVGASGEALNPAHFQAHLRARYLG